MSFGGFPAGKFFHKEAARDSPLKLGLPPRVIRRVLNARVPAVLFYDEPHSGRICLTTRFGQNEGCCNPQIEEGVNSSVSIKERRSLKVFCRSMSDMWGRSLEAFRRYFPACWGFPC